MSDSEILAKAKELADDESPLRRQYAQGLALIAIAESLERIAKHGIYVDLKTR